MNKFFIFNTFCKGAIIGCLIYGCQNQSVKTINYIPEKMEVKSILETQCLLGEGPIWNRVTKQLYFIDIEGKNLFVYEEGHEMTDVSPRNQKLRKYHVGERIGTVVPTNDSNKAIVALQNGVFELDLTTEKKTLISNPEENRADTRLNDGKCDPAGRLWVGSMHLDLKAKKGALYKIETDGTHEKMIDSVSISNGIVWSLDEKTMYYIDTPTRKVQSFDYDKTTGNISNGRIAIEIPKESGRPDGMAIDAEGMLWVALWNGDAVTRWNPNTGEMIQKIEIPAHNVTACAFGGDNLETLFITSARVDMTDEELEQKPLSGNVFAVKPGVRGVNTFHFGK